MHPPCQPLSGELKWLTDTDQIVCGILSKLIDYLKDREHLGNFCISFCIIATKTNDQRLYLGLLLHFLLCLDADVLCLFAFFTASKPLKHGPICSDVVFCIWSLMAHYCHPSGFLPSSVAFFLWLFAISTTRNTPKKMDQSVVLFLFRFGCSGLNIVILPDLFYRRLHISYDCSQVLQRPKSAKSLSRCIT